MTEEGKSAQSLAGAGNGRIPVSGPQDRPLVLLKYLLKEDYHVIFIIGHENWKKPKNL